MNEVFLYVYPEKAADGSIQFLMSQDSNQRPPQGTQYPVPQLKKNSGKCTFTVSIQNPEGLDVKFAAQPIWSADNIQECPPAGKNSDQITDITPLNNTQFSFLNRNKGKDRVISYQLNMTNDGIACPLDPDIRNGGGTGTKSLAYALIGAAGGALLSYLTQGMFDPQVATTYALAFGLLGFALGYLIDRL